MNTRAEQLSELIFKETENRELINTYQKIIKINSFILSGLWFVAISIFIFTTTYVKDNHLLFVGLMSGGGVFLFFGLVIPMIWIIVNNLRIKKYYLSLYKNKTLDLYKLACMVIKDIKIFADVNNQLHIERNNHTQILDSSKDLKLNIKFIEAKYKSYYETISKSICEQIAKHVIEIIEKSWEK